MATIYRKVYPVPMPEGAEIITRRGQRLARWTDGNGNVKTAPLSADGTKIMHEAGPWYARYRDADGAQRRVSTGCCDERPARQVLADLVAGVEKIKAGIITVAEAKTADHANRPAAKHVEEYLEHLATKRVRGRKVSAQYRMNTRGRLKRLVAQCGFLRLADITRTAVEKWLAGAEDGGMTAATRNEYLASIHAFCNWAVGEGRLLANPLMGVQKADRSGDRRRQRRAMTEDEVARLLRAATMRPVAEAGRLTMKLPPEKSKGRHSWTYRPMTVEDLDACYDRGFAKLQKRPANLAKLQRLGRERALFYRMAVLTGLRRNELASLTVGQLHLDAVPAPFVELLARDAKNAKTAYLPLRADLVAELKAFLEERLDDSRRITPEMPQEELPLTTRLFKNVPTIRIFDADIAAAGLPKADQRGRTLDIHALRHTFGTHLSLAGVLPRTAQAAMRHSRIELTMNVYTDPVLLDVAGAVNALPSFGHVAVAEKAAAAANAG